MLERPGVLSIVFAVLTSSAPLAAQQAERRWVVDNSATSHGDGTPTSPFLTLAEAVKAAGEGDTILVSATEKPYAGGIILGAGQSLIGEGGAPVIAASEGAVLATTPSARPLTIANVVVRASGTAHGIAVRDVAGTVTLRDVEVTTTSGIGLLVTKTKKVVVSGATSIASVNAPAVRIEEAELDAVLRSVSARGESLPAGILLQKTTGRFIVEGGTIEGAARAVSAIEAANVTLRGMRLVGSAPVNGVAPTGCGGDLDGGSNERCNAAVYLHSVDGATLDQVAVEGSKQAGIVAHRVRNLTIEGSSVRNAGDELFEHGLVLEELIGDCRIAASTVAGSASRHLMLHNSGGRLAVVIEKSTFSDTGTPHGQQGLLVTGSGDAVIDLRVRDSSFLRTFSNALEVIGSGKAAFAVRVTGSTFERNASAVSLALTEAATLDYVIANNPVITGSENAAINVYLGSPSTGVLSGTIAHNTIGKSGVPRSGAGCSSCSGISLTATGNGSFIADVSGNVIQQTAGGGIHATASQGGSQMNLTATANLLREGGPAAPAIRVQSGALANDTTSVCADIGGSGARANTIQGVWEPNGAIHLIHRFGGTHFRIAGSSGGKTAEEAAATVGGRNGGALVRAVLRPDSMEKGFEPAERCTMPALTK